LEYFSTQENITEASKILPLINKNLVTTGLEIKKTNKVKNSLLQYLSISVHIIPFLTVFSRIYL
jgi:hypothetical protein